MLQEKVKFVSRGSFAENDYVGADAGEENLEDSSRQL